MRGYRRTDNCSQTTAKCRVLHAEWSVVETRTAVAIGMRARTANSDTDAHMKLGLPKPETQYLHTDDFTTTPCSEAHADGCSQDREHDRTRRRRRFFKIPAAGECVRRTKRPEHVNERRAHERQHISLKQTLVTHI